MIANSTICALVLAGLTVSAVAGQTVSASDALDRFLHRSSCQRGVEEQAMEIEIQASLPSLKKQGSMHGLKVISASGQVAYRFLRFTGDKLVKTDVIARFLTAEVHPPEHLGDVGITSRNYRFHYLRSEAVHGATAFVYQLKPRQKREGLFKGELWLDGAAGAPIRESGELVKSPSIFIKKVGFVRDFTQTGSCGPPQRTSLTVQTRVAGSAEMVVLQHPVASTWQPADEATSGDVLSVQ
jgi:hypothetical protein